MTNFTTIDFINKSKSIYDENKYDYSKVKYIDTETKVNLACKKHNLEFFQKPREHWNHEGCKKCKREHIFNKKLLESWVSFLNESYKLYGDKFSFINSKFITRNDKIEIICSKHGSFTQRPSRFLKGITCQKCGFEKSNSSRKLSFEDFVNKANKVHHGFYDYSLVNYVNTETLVEIICPIHGSFWQTPHGHMNGCGCTDCKFDKIRKIRIKSYDEFVLLANETHGEGTYIYDETTYTKFTSRTRIFCRKHGDFWQTPKSHCKGNGCSICNESHGERTIRFFLQNNNYNFEEQKRFKDCKDKYSLPFDFYIPQYNLCIEFDGKQHFYKYGFETNDRFNYRQNHDSIKTKFCKDNKIELLRIKYDEDAELKLINKLKSLENKYKN